MTPSLKSFFRLFLPLAVLILLSAYFYVETNRQARLGNLKADEALNVSMGAAMLDRRTQIVRKDLAYLARHNRISEQARPLGAVDLPHMERDFIDFLSIRPVYDQARWIDASGQEILRVDLKGGEPVLVPKAMLQNKADRYYFAEAMKLEPGEIYVSPSDLNVENGTVEVPYKPMLRVATPVADAQGKKHGMIILNYLADEMIAYMEAVTPQVADHLMLLNTEGYFIHAPDPADEWGFMFNDAQRSLPARFPESWARMVVADHGQFIDAYGLWSFQVVYPLQAVGASIDEVRRSATHPISALEMGRRWLVVAHLPPERLNQLTSRNQIQAIFTALLLLFVAAAGVAAVVRARERERVTEQQFQVCFERAMVGMAKTSLEKRWLAVNPALCNMLGYSAEELLTKTWSELTHPDDVDLNVAQYEKVLSGEQEGYELEKRFLRPDGQSVDVVIAAQVVRQEDGSPDYFVVIIEDISQRLMAERQQRQSFETLRGFIDHLPGMAYIKDQDSRIVVANQRFEELLGLNPQDLIGQRTEDIFPGDAGEKFVRDDRAILASGRASVFEETLGERIYETVKFPIPHENALPGLGGISMDISDRKQNEKMLALLAQRAAVLLALAEKSLTLDESAFMGYVLDMAETLTDSPIGFMHWVNPGEESIELVAWSTRTLDKYCTAAFDCHDPITQADVWADAARLKRPVVINDYALAENRHGLPERHSILSRLISVPVMEGGAVRMMAGVGNKAQPYTDVDVETLQLLGNEACRIVRQQRAEKALQIANQVVNASPVVCFRWAATGGWPVVFVSENVAQWGYTPAELQAGRPSFAELVHPDDLVRIASEVAAKTAAGACSYEQEYRLLTRENRAIWVVDRTIVRRDASGAAEFYDGVLTDVTDRKNRQLALVSTLAEQKTLNKRLEEAHNQLLQSEKMASIGQLAAGIAHELNNPIGFVHSNLGTLDGYIRDLMEIIAAYDELVVGQAPDCPSLGKVRMLKEERDFDYIAADIGSLLGESKDGLARVRKIVQDLKNFSHVSEQEWQWADLHQGIDSTLNIVWNELKYKCKVVKEYGELPKVFCMISQLNQVFMNLLVNAGHAIEGSGTITIHSTCRGDDEICIEFRDTGKGIAPEHLKRIFEPFFTTKPVGKGTGLGLSLAYGIIDKHHGRIEVESTVGQGSAFRIILPINPGTGAASASMEISA